MWRALPDVPDGTSGTRKHRVFCSGVPTPLAHQHLKESLPRGREQGTTAADVVPNGTAPSSGSRRAAPSARTYSGMRNGRNSRPRVATVTAAQMRKEEQEASIGRGVSAASTRTLTGRARCNHGGLGKAASYPASRTWAVAPSPCSAACRAPRYPRSANVAGGSRQEARNRGGETARPRVVKRASLRQKRCEVASATPQSQSMRRPTVFFRPCIRSPALPIS